MSSSEAQSSFPDTQQRTAFCESAYDNRSRGTNTFLQSDSFKQATCAARRVSFQGRPFRVVPSVLVRSQVLRNNLGATFLPAEEITDEWAAQWNHIPVLVGPHPSQRGAASTGRTPELVNERGVGFIFAARAENGPDGTRRLVGEVWLDVERAAVVAGFQAVLDRLDAGQPVELSTGFTTMVEEVTGVHNGEAYELLVHPQLADHLVISTEMTGACAVADGCGLGANQEAKVAEQTGAPAPAATTPKEPIGIKALLTRVVDYITPRAKAFSWEDHETERLSRAVIQLQLTPSDTERAQMLKEALQEAVGDSEREVIICDVYDEPEPYVVFWFMTPMGPRPKGMEFYRIAWSVDSDGDGKPEVKGEPVLVRRQVSYEPVEDGSAANAAGSGSPAGADATPAEQSHNQKQEVEEMADNTKDQGLGELTAAVANLTQLVQSINTKVSALETQSAPAELIGLKRTVSQLVEEFGKMKGVTEAAINERERERQFLVRELAGNHKVAFGTAELEAMPIDTLRKLQNSLEGASFSGQGGPQTGVQNEKRFAAPRKYWEDEQKGGK